jgi:sugar/nucleoside kinase (ribokinase family)
VPRVLVVGDLMTVVTGRVARFPRSGENVVLEGAALYASGVAANISMNLAALGVEAVIVGAVGADGPGEQVLAELRAAGVDVSLVRVSPDSPTASMVVMIEPSGERTMIGTRGASERFMIEPIEVLAHGGSPDWLHVSGYTLLDPAMEARCDVLVSAAASLAIPCSVDLEGIGTSGRRTTLDRALTFCNRAEFRGYFGTDALEEVAPRRTAPLVVKAGSEGCYLVELARVLRVVAAPAGDPVDATGAGDAFDAAFITARLSGFVAERACRWGNAAGARTVSAPGPRAHLERAAIDQAISP